MADETAPAEPTGYQPFFGLPKDGSKKPVPKWVPLTLVRPPVPFYSHTNPH